MYLYENIIGTFLHRSMEYRFFNQLFREDVDKEYPPIVPTFDTVKEKDLDGTNLAVPKKTQSRNKLYSGTHIYFGGPIPQKFPDNIPHIKVCIYLSGFV